MKHTHHQKKGHPECIHIHHHSQFDLLLDLDLLFHQFFTLIGNRIIVRPEEALIVILVLILWVGAISLFFHRWGKIRMLEPYTPKFEEAIHRPSCPLTTLEAVATKRMSLAPMSIQWSQTGLNPIRGEIL